MIYKFILFSPRLLKNPVKEHQGMNLQLVVDLISEPTVNQKQKQQTPTCVCVCICMHMYAHTNMLLHKSILIYRDILNSVHECMCACTYVHMYVCMYVCMYAYMNVCPALSGSSRAWDATLKAPLLCHHDGRGASSFR